MTFTPGGAVTAERRSQTSFRLSFSMVDPEQLEHRRIGPRHEPGAVEQHAIRQPLDELSQLVARRAQRLDAPLELFLLAGNAT